MRGGVGVTAATFCVANCAGAGMIGWTTSKGGSVAMPHGLMDAMAVDVDPEMAASSRMYRDH